MKFALSTALKNIRRKPFRSAVTAVLVVFLSVTVCTGAYVILSLRRGLQGYRDRLGADIVVVPSSAKGHGSVDDILLQGITGNYYIAEKDVEKVLSTEGIGEVSAQFFLTSAKASCCSTRVQIIGFDPESDFVVQPWIRDSFSGDILDGEVIAGSSINVPSDKTVTFYGTDYKVAAQLAPTGTGLDSAVYANMKTIRKMAESAARLLDTPAFKGVNLETASSALLIRVADGYDIDAVADDINIHVTKVEAESSKHMVTDIASGLDQTARVIRILLIVVWVLVVVILFAAFALIANERKKEFAILRVMGASQRMLFGIMSIEAVLTSLIGAAIGVAVSYVLIISFGGALKDALEMPFSAPGAGETVLIAAASVLLSVGAGFCASAVLAGRMTRSEASLLMKEDG